MQEKERGESKRVERIKRRRKDRGWKKEEERNGRGQIEDYKTRTGGIRREERLKRGNQ